MGLHRVSNMNVDNGRHVTVAQVARLKPGATGGTYDRPAEAGRFKAVGTIIRHAQARTGDRESGPGHPSTLRPRAESHRAPTKSPSGRRRATR